MKRRESFGLFLWSRFFFRWNRNFFPQRMATNRFFLRYSVQIGRKYSPKNWWPIFFCRMRVICITASWETVPELKFCRPFENKNGWLSNGCITHFIVILRFYFARLCITVWLSTCLYQVFSDSKASFCHIVEKKYWTLLSLFYFKIFLLSLQMQTSLVPFRISFNDRYYSSPSAFILVGRFNWLCYDFCTRVIKNFFVISWYLQFYCCRMTNAEQLHTPLAVQVFCNLVLSNNFSFCC